MTPRSGAPSRGPRIVLAHKARKASKGRLPSQYERGGDGRFHDGVLMDLLRDELAPGR